MATIGKEVDIMVVIVVNLGFLCQNVVGEIPHIISLAR